MEGILADLDAFVAMTESINSHLDLEHVLQTVTDTGTRLSGARFGAFFYNAVTDDEQRYRFYVVSGADAAAFATMPSPHITALFEPTFSGRGAVRIADIAHDERVRGLPAGHLPLRSYLATPVVARSGEVIGALLFGHPETDRFTQRSEDVVRLVATQAAVAVENARLFADEQAARLNAEQVAARIALLQTITARLASAVTHDDALTAVVESLVAPLQCHRVGVYLREGDTFRAVAGTRTDAAPEVPANSTQVQVLPADFPSPISAAAEQRVPIALRDAAELAVAFPELAGLVHSVEASLSLPLIRGDVVLGVLVLAWPRPREFSSSEIEMLTAAAGQLVAALERARLYEAERTAQAQLRASAAHASAVSRTLQRSLLPRTLPSVDSVSVAVRYLPGTADAEVGGDWYDVITTPDGGAVFVVGDVQGHSIAAAAVMGQLRTALHAYLAEGHEPHVAVARVNAVMTALNARVLATCCLVALDPASGQVAIVRAGHPLPLLRKADGTVSEVESDGGIPLGVFEDGSWPTTVMTLEAGDRLLLYTDGLVENPGADVTVGVDALTAATAGAGHGDIEADVDEILAAVGPGLRDDVALLVCDYAGPSGTREWATIEVRDVAQVADARAFTCDTLDHWKLVRLEDTMTLLVSELVTNALVHTDGSATLELRREAERVRIMVTDEHTRVPRAIDADDDATGGRGMFLVEALAEDWGVEPSGTGKTVWAEVLAD